MRDAASRAVTPAASRSMPLYDSPSPAILAEHDGRTLRVRLNRPERENAVDYEMIGAMLALTREAAGDGDLRAVVFEGEGRSFCAGEAREGMGEWPPEYARRRPGGSHGAAPLPQQDLLTAVRALDRPTVAVLAGRTLGFGLDLAAVCDIRLAATDAETGDPRVHEARHAATGITHLLPRLIGLSQAMRLLLLGESVDGGEAEAIGLVHFACTPEGLDAAADELVARLAKMATRSYGVIKEQLVGQLDLPYDQALMHSLAVRQTNVIEDRGEAARAFIEKRDAHFTGR